MYVVLVQINALSRKLAIVQIKALSRIFVEETETVVTGLQKLLQPCSRTARKWRENEEMKRKWRENEEIERKWRENEEMERE